jgi:cytoskeletal protein RodZ
LSKKLKLITFTASKVCVFVILLIGILGCRPLSKFFDPNKNVLTKKVVQRDKPNLSETASREPDVDPDSDELQEETEDPPKPSEDNADVRTESNTDTEPENNANANSDTNPDQADPQTEQIPTEPKPKSPVGRWQGTNPDRQTVIFEFTGAGKLIIYADNEPQGNPVSYTVSGDKTLELRKDGRTVKVNYEISADGKTMRFSNPEGETQNLTKVN